MSSPFLIDAGGDVSTTPLEVEAAARAAESSGYDGMIVAETKHDPFIGLTLAARGTERIALTSGIAVAFARSPMTIAMAANDIQLVSGGRFMLGLGSQVKAHIERRFSMPWSQPAARMAEYVEAVRAIWHAWATGERLKFAGEFYTHTLMSPFFDPGPNPHGNPPVWIAAVGEGMAETAGRVADGVIGHSFTTRRYLDEVTIPAIARGRDAAGRDPDASASASRLSSPSEPTSPSSTSRSRPRAGRSRSTDRRPPTGRCSNCTAGVRWPTSCTGRRPAGSGT